MSTNSAATITSSVEERTLPLKASVAPKARCASRGPATPSLSTALAETTRSDPWNCSSWRSLLVRISARPAENASPSRAPPTSRKGSTARRLVGAAVPRSCDSHPCSAGAKTNAAATPPAMASAKAPANPARRGQRLLRTAVAPVSSAISSSRSSGSCADWKRSCGSLARQRLTTCRSAAGTSGGSASGSWLRMA